MRVGFHRTGHSGDDEAPVQVDAAERPDEDGGAGFVPPSEAAGDGGAQLAAMTLEHVAAPVAVVDASSGILAYANASWSRMFGYVDREAVGRHVAAVHAPSDEAAPGEQLRHIMRALNRDGLWSGRLHSIRKDGARFWCTATITKFEVGDAGERWAIAYPPTQLPLG